jgi:hypothetical protein
MLNTEAVICPVALKTDITEKLSKVPQHLQVLSDPQLLPNIWQLRSQLYSKHYSGFSNEQTDSFDQHSLVLYSKNTEQKITSTGRLVIDSKYGLPADEYVKDELDVLRAQGLILAEPSKFAISKEAQGFLVNYLQTFYEIGMALSIDAFIFIINQKNVAFYEKIVDAKVLKQSIGYSYGTLSRFSLLMCSIQKELPSFFSAWGSDHE